jgi:hypothetical protein
LHNYCGALGMTRKRLGPIFPIRYFSVCKDNANRVKFQRKTRFSLHFRDEAYLRALLRDNANILSAQILNGKSYVIIISLPSFLCLWLNMLTNSLLSKPTTTFQTIGMPHIGG